MVSELWVEKYRPQKINDYVFRDKHLKDQVAYWIKEKTIPHILLSGPAGTGKSSLANVLVNELKIESGDIMKLNASDENNVETVRNKVSSFASTIAIGDFKVIIMEEFDYMTINGQAILRAIMEDYSEACRFILTCNYIHKIIPAIKSRCQEIVLQSLDKEAFQLKIFEILDLEKIQDLSAVVDYVDTYIEASYPDLRKCINTLQLNSIKLHDNNIGLLKPASTDNSTSDWQIHAIDLIKKGNIGEARKLIVGQIRAEEFEEFYRMCYRNLDWWGKTEQQKEEAILLIREGLVKHTSCADPEINLSATLIQLARIGK